MEWIDVKDRLPQEVEKTGIEVLVSLVPKDRMYGNVKMAVFYRGKFHKDFNKGFILKVTHWMSLPEPPKKS